MAHLRNCECWVFKTKKWVVVLISGKTWLTWPDLLVSAPTRMYFKDLMQLFLPFGLQPPFSVSSMWSASSHSHFENRERWFYAIKNYWLLNFGSMLVGKLTIICCPKIVEMSKILYGWLNDIFPTKKWFNAILFQDYAIIENEDCKFLDRKL